MCSVLCVHGCVYVWGVCMCGVGVCVCMCGACMCAWVCGVCVLLIYVVNLTV